MATPRATTWDLAPDAVGVLPSQWIDKALASGVIRAPRRDPVPSGNVQPASLDLRLGPKAYRIRASFLPDKETVNSKLAHYALEEFDLTRGHVLEPNCPYLIPLVERLALPSFVRAKANPKSSTGRLDIFTRVITDRSQTFDEIASGYNGPLYLEVVSRTFTVRARAGLSLNQLRLLVGKPGVEDDGVPRDRVLFKNDVTLSGSRVASDDKGVYLSLDLEGDADGVVGLRAKRNSRLLDLSLTDHYDARDFWEPVVRERDVPRVVLEPEEFYLMLSEEAVRIPADYAAEMSPYTSSGELRTHYAGFFDPGFGQDPDRSLRGSRAALEVRAHDVPFAVEQGQQVCRLTFERMLEAPAYLYGQELGSNYQAQRLTLSKHFRFPRREGDQLSLWATA
ncbi:MAG: 2'-deoxycytidine 5'-triphosphate deaminase [Acidimicrobiia bacterium]